MKYKDNARCYSNREKSYYKLCFQNWQKKVYLFVTATFQQGRDLYVVGCGLGYDGTGMYIIYIKVIYINMNSV